jgi:hypothetical protein
MRLSGGILISLVGAVCRPAYSDELQERAAIRDEVTTAWKAGDYDTLERIHTRYSDFLRERTSSGASKMGLFIDGLTEGNDASEDVLKRDIDRTGRWAKAHPDSPLGYVLHAESLKAYAWHVRGSGYANTVLPQAWAVYHEYQQRAAKYLIENQVIASRTTSWHASLMVVGRGEGWAPEVLTRMFEDGVAKNPADYRLYQYRLNALLPKWNGSTQQVDAFVREVSRRAPSAYGMELYARLYSAAGEEQYGRALYSDSLVDWSMMKAGLQAWIDHFPTSWNKNIFAYHACLAGDKAAAKPLFDAIADQPEWEIWEPNARMTFDSCRQWVADPRAEPMVRPPQPPATRREARSPEEAHPA